MRLSSVFDWTHQTSVTRRPFSSQIEFQIVLFPKPFVSNVLMATDIKPKHDCARGITVRNFQIQILSEKIDCSGDPNGQILIRKCMTAISINYDYGQVRVTVKRQFLRKRQNCDVTLVRTCVVEGIKEQKLILVKS